MQVHALDSAGELLSAQRAKKQHDYICLECGTPVRLRSGLHRQAHFYHLQPTIKCTLHAKGMSHLLLQQQLKEWIPEIEIECRFSEINRIADAAWHSKKLTFEIQCSPITASELHARTATYRFIGYQVVWIFHDQRYNQKKLSSAEDAALSMPHYFFSMDEQKNSIIYDQFSFVSNGLRNAQLPRLPVDISSVHFLASARPRLLTQAKKNAWFLRQRLEKWPVCFTGDLVYHLQHMQSNQFNKIVEPWNDSFFSKKFSLNVFIKKSVRHLLAFYRILLSLLLEKLCR